MEDKLKTNQVMDIQPPKPPETVASQPQQTPPVSEQPVVAESAQAPEVAATEQVPDVYVTDVQEAPAEERADEENQNHAIEADAPILAATAQQPHKRHTPVFAIIAALVISGVLAALTVYSFMDSDQSKDTTASQTEAPTQAADAAKSSDIDALNSTIDQDLQTIDDTSDYSDAPVNDASLGL